MERQRVVVIRSLFATLSLGAAAVAGILAYNETSSWWLVAFVVTMTVYAFGRALPDLITDTNKARRAAFFGLPLLLAVGGVALSYWAMGEWWSAVLVGFGAGWVGWVLAAVSLPEIAQEEQEDSLARLSGGWPEGVPRTQVSGAQPQLDELFRAVREAGIALTPDEERQVARAYVAGDYDAIARLLERKGAGAPVGAGTAP